MTPFDDLKTAPATPDPAVDLYALAMSLRGAADGSAEGTLHGDEPIIIRGYLRRRLAVWGKSRSESEELFRQFIIACIAESERQAPWLFKE